MEGGREAGNGGTEGGREGKRVDREMRTWSTMLAEES